MARSRIAIVVPSAYRMGGVQTWLDYLLPGLEAAGWDVTLLLVHGALNNAHQYLQQHPFPRVHLVESPTGTSEGRVRALCRAIRLCDPQLVLAVNIVDVYEAVARLRIGGSCPKVVMALHGFNSSFYEDIARWSQVLDGVIVTNKLAAAAAVRRGGISEDRVHYAPCGVLIPKVRHPVASTSELILLYAGRFDAREKRVLDLHPILRSLDRRGLQFTVKLAGDGPAGLELRNSLREFGDRVSFLGALDAAQMRASFFCAGAIVLVMSPSETGPLVAWEAMACGAVVVTAQFIGIGLEDSLRDGETCLTFPVGDAEAAADAISSLVDPALRRTLATGGYELVRKRYGRDASVQAWDRALRSVMTQVPLQRFTTLPSRASAGRMDRVLGVGVAESVRAALGLRFAHQGPGSEWPHSYSVEDDADFNRLLVHLDRRCGGPAMDSERSSQGA